MKVYIERIKKGKRIEEYIPLENVKLDNGLLLGDYIKNTDKSILDLSNEIERLKNIFKEIITDIGGIANEE